MKITLTIEINEPSNEVKLLEANIVKESPGLEKRMTVCDVLGKYVGVKEYNGIVAVIQKWFYGSVSHTAWCASAMSWALAQCGIMAYTIGTKQDNVYNFLMKCISQNNCTKIDQYQELKRGDLVFMLYSAAPMKADSSKHICAVWEDAPAGKSAVNCIGGNQGDSIRIDPMKRENMYMVMRPNYAIANVL